MLCLCYIWNYTDLFEFIIVDYKMSTLC